MSPLSKGLRHHCSLRPMTETQCFVTHRDPTELSPRRSSELHARPDTCKRCRGLSARGVSDVVASGRYKMTSSFRMLVMLAVLILAIGAPAALADCSDRTYNCILSADVSYDSSTNQATTVTGGCSSGGDGVSQPDSSGDGSDSADDTDSGDVSSDSPENLSATPSCNVGGSGSSSSSTQFLAKGTSAGFITQGRCFQLFGGCLPNQCSNSQKPEDICNSQHAQCAGSCTAVCTDACSNT